MVEGTSISSMDFSELMLKQWSSTANHYMWTRELDLGQGLKPRGKHHTTLALVHCFSVDASI